MSHFFSDNQQPLDGEWVELMLYAKSKGLTKEEVRKILLILREQEEAVVQESAV